MPREKFGLEKGQEVFPDLFNSTSLKRRFFYGHRFDKLFQLAEVKYPLANVGGIVQVINVSSRLSLKYGIMISSLPVSKYKKDNSKQEVHQEIRKKGISL